MPMATWITLFIIVDAIVVYFVIRHALRKHGALGLGAIGLGFQQLAAFAKEVHEEVGRYMQANYSGDPQHLPQAMSGLLAVVRTRAEQRGLTLDVDILKKLIAASAARHKVARESEIRSALERAA